MAFLETRTFPIHYSFHRSHRDNPTVLLIHELTTDASEWSLVTQYLRNTLNFVMYDSLGQRPGHPLTFEHLISEARALIDALKLKQVHVVGHGIGGNIGFELARRYPVNVASLTMIATHFSFQEDLVRKPLSLLTQLITIDRHLFVQKVLKDNFYRRTDEKVRIFEKAFKKITAQTVKEKIHALQDFYKPPHFNYVDALGRITVPTMIVHGTDDSVYPVQLAALYALCIPDCHFVTIPWAAHHHPLDQPERTARSITEFILGEKSAPLVFSIHKKMAADFREILTKGMYPSTSRHLLRMNVMNATEILWNGKPISGKWNQRGAKELLLYLILHQGVCSRSELIQAFLPDLPPRRARAHLRIRINHFNQILHDCNMGIQDLLLIGEDTVALNAEIESDLGNYMNDLSQLAHDKRPLTEISLAFINRLKQYDPASFTAFRGDWIFALATQIERQLSDLMELLLPKLRAQKLFTQLQAMLQNGKRVEPYDGYCDEYLAELQEAGLIKSS